MANPQKENGHIDIANEIAEALARTNLSKYETRYLWVLWRKTYGWHKKTDVISKSQFSEATGINRTHIWRTEKELIQRNIVTRMGTFLGFNKDYTQWREVPKRVPSTHSGMKRTRMGTKKVPELVHTKETTKETIQKKLLFDDFWSIYPNKKNKKDSKKVWDKLPIALQETIMADIPRRKEGSDWKRDGGRYIPHPTTYLRGERWTDSIEASITKQSLILRP